MNINKILLFLKLHWVKLAAGLVVVLAISLPIIALRRIDPYQRDYILAMESFLLITSIMSGGIFVFLLYWLNYGGGFSKLQKKSLKSENVNIHWDDVIGMDEAKQEAWEVLELIRDRILLQRMGGQILRGILMIGPPGCGKTYLAKAIATESGLPFLSMSGSEFVEIFVGVGASRVRKLFKTARQLAFANGGCIIFIDELDAIGRKRVFSVFGGTEETNSTQNQLLAEMDGLQDKEYNIVVIGATNALEGTLDEALLRPGRFDRKIFIRKPSLEGREKLFRYYLSKITHEPDVDIGRLARKAVQKSPADIANIVREATLITARNHKARVGMKELMEAMERIEMGIKHKITYTPEERRRIAYHESGHLIIMYTLHPTKDVFKASLVARGEALGVVHPQWKEEIFTHSKDEYIADIKVYLSGYISERMKCAAPSSGCAADFQAAMGIAHNMVWSFGMGTSNLLGDYSAIPHEQLSETIKEKLNNETQHIIQECMKEVEALLKKEETLLDRFAKELIDRDELDYDEIHAIFSEYGKAHGQLPGNFPPPLPGPGEDKTKDGPGRNTAQNPKP